MGGYLGLFVNDDQDDWYYLLPLAEFPYNNSVTNAHKMTAFFAHYDNHPQTEWLKECEAPNPGPNHYSHGMQTMHEQARQSLESTRLGMRRYYDHKTKQQPDFKIGNMVMLNAKHIQTKRPSKKLAGKQSGPVKMLEQLVELTYKLELSECWKVHPVFHISRLEPYRTSIRPAREQQSTEPAQIDGDLE